jgi:hypothetical protein
VKLIERLLRRTGLVTPPSSDDAVRIMREVGNHGLADEMQRGMDRRKMRKVEAE